jgi:hypothetical protein
MSTLASVFTAPGAAFRKLKEKPVWILPLILYVLFSLGLTYITISHSNPAEMRSRAEESMRSRGMPDDQIQQNLDRMDKMTSSPAMRYGFPLFGALVVTVIMLLLVSLVLMPLVPMSGGTSPGFLRNFSIVCYASVVSILGMILRGVLIILRGPLHADIGLSAFTPSLKAGFLYALLARLDPFSVWNTILVALGLKIVYDLKDSRIYYYIFALWIAFLLISSLLGGGQGMMMAR